MTTFSAEDLNKEKKKVKNELKVYDQSFLAKFKRLPNRVEKEPMRNLYMHYKRLKQCISKMQQRASRGGSSSNPGSSS